MNEAKDARDAILRAIRNAPDARQRPFDVTAPADILHGLELITPATPEGLLQQFLSELEALGATVGRAAAPSDVAADVRGYLRLSGMKRIGLATTTDLTTALADDFETIALASLPPADRRTWLTTADAVVTDADFALADTGSLVFTPATLPDRLVAALPRCHVVILDISRLLPHMWALIERRDTMEHPLFFVTGPSRTADIEKLLVLGAHGPAALRVVLVDSPSA